MNVPLKLLVFNDFGFCYIGQVGSIFIFHFINFGLLETGGSWVLVVVGLTEIAFLKVVAILMMFVLDIFFEDFPGERGGGKEGDSDVDESEGEVDDVDGSEAGSDALVNIGVPDELTNSCNQ